VLLTLRDSLLVDNISVYTFPLLSGGGVLALFWRFS
jgi:hypothetical protein